MAKVIQADRDHAAELARTIKTHTCSERGNMIAGRDDDNALVQAFAAHREASTAKLEADMAVLVALVDRSFAAINAGIAMADAEWRNSDSAVDRNDRIIRDYRNDAREALTRIQGEYRSGETVSRCDCGEPATTKYDGDDMCEPCARYCAKRDFEEGDMPGGFGE